MAGSRQGGFTLIELMVVLVIVGIATAAISLSTRPDPTRLLRQDAARLAQLLEIAQGEARLRGTPILWQANAKGYRFSPQAYRGKADAFAADAQLRARHWQAAPLQVSVRPSRPVLLDAEWIGAPLLITLSDGQHSVTVRREANGHVRVR
ncbi:MULTISPECIES: type II secretion system minor pseudopilin GspH [Pseudomonas aeruginosa group]|uniref:Type II secretion system protein H n=2 Tax=Pseudomonas TaxID=286 RepID=A0A2R3J072_9PSED|nr:MULTISPECIES: type II secretion system minor pseudopilin GspH [Pseudomonas aeruginosa group]AVK07581.1 type II secretion system protein H [Pseudomonas paraeruginosa]AVR69444.1 type II secretion system protein GspH [Pseudomonas paraeruginosa]AWE92203.1 type II secretion system protein H [Pseudomonas paraeruginosa]KAB0739729.1 type II secretion system protein GspH [Pseudomonas aeruginosa]KSC50342.2 type II secretion system protein GspH [Pseudomonas paraeruginosa]